MRSAGDPGRGLKLPEAEKWNSNDEEISGNGCGIVAQSLELLLSGGLQRSKAAGVPVGDGTEE